VPKQTRPRASQVIANLQPRLPVRWP